MICTIDEYAIAYDEDDGCIDVSAVINTQTLVCRLAHEMHCAELRYWTRKVEAELDEPFAARAAAAWRRYARDAAIDRSV